MANEQKAQRQIVLTLIITAAIQFLWYLDKIVQTQVERLDGKVALELHHHQDEEYLLTVVGQIIIYILIKAGVVMQTKE
jgi:hypothetical protein